MKIAADKLKAQRIYDNIEIEKIVIKKHEFQLSLLNHSLFDEGNETAISYHEFMIEFATNNIKKLENKLKNISSQLSLF